MHRTTTALLTAAAGCVVAAAPAAGAATPPQALTARTSVARDAAGGLYGRTVLTCVHAATISLDVGIRQGESFAYAVARVVCRPGRLVVWQGRITPAVGAHDPFAARSMLVTTTLSAPDPTTGLGYATTATHSQMPALRRTLPVR